jgi:hypothetical protein
MRDALNNHCFSQPHWIVIARGHKPEDWFGVGESIGNGGITNPQPEHLKVGQFYYRFANSQSPRHAQLGGGWWLDYENFDRIKTFARKNGYNLSYAARLFLALPYDWTRADRLVTAILEVPLKAYTGKGNPARGSNDDARNKGTIFADFSQDPIKQLFIPGLYIKSAKHQGPQLYELAFPDHKSQYIGGNLEPAPEPK